MIDWMNDHFGLVIAATIIIPIVLGIILDALGYDAETFKRKIGL